MKLNQLKSACHPASWAYLLVAAAVLTRFIPHLPNFAPAFGALLFSGACLRRRDAVWYPVTLLALSDLVLTTQIYHMQMALSQVVVWAGFAVVALIGFLLRGRTTARNILVASLAGPVAFFVISNLGVWLEGGLYPMTASGLAACYVAALPFFQYSVVGSMLSSALLFGVFTLWQKSRSDAPRISHAL